MLRHRIVLGVAPIILLSGMIGGCGGWLFVRLGGAVNTTRREDHTSIVARATAGPDDRGSKFFFVLSANISTVPATPSHV
jgi:hypothetical protein